MKENVAIIVRRILEKERRKSVAKTATGLEPNSLAILDEHSLLTVIRPTKLHTYKGNKL